VPGILKGISGKHVVQLVSANFKGAPKFVSYLLKLDLHHVHNVRWRDLDSEMPGDLALNVTIINQCSSRPNNDFTERRSGRQRLFGNCTFKFDIICDGGTPIHVSKVALDHIEVQVAVHQDDSSGVPNTKQPENSWHRVNLPVVIGDS
jgi:hypothetical protein